MTTHCLVCRSQEVRLLARNSPGYVRGSTFDIWACRHCECHFVSPLDVTKHLYELIYDGQVIPGYDRYEAYAHEVLLSDDPLGVLALQEAIYGAVKKYVEGRRRLDILEIGSGLGYLTYALRREGHDAVGIDISEKAVQSARSRFGPHFEVAAVEDVACRSATYDLVIATEVIEHTPDPVKFARSGYSIVRPGGGLLITTPNRDYSPSKAVWQTDIPPVHTCWLGKRSFQYIASVLNGEVTFMPLAQSWTTRENRLLHLVKRLGDPLWSGPVVDHEGAPVAVLKKQVLGTALCNAARNSLTERRSLRSTCNLLHRLLYRQHHELAVLLVPPEGPSTV